MASLRELRNKLNTVKSTRKLTAAMKLVAGVKLRKAECKAISCRGYSDGLSKIISGIRQDFLEYKPELLVGHDTVKTVMLVVLFADRGLCGNFNYGLIKEAKNAMDELHANGKNVYLLCLCQKAFDALKKFVSGDDKIKLLSETKKNDVSYENFEKVTECVLNMFLSYEIDQVCVIYTKYISAMNKSVVLETIVPTVPQERKSCDSIAVFEPDEKFVLDSILKKNVTVQLYQAALENFASEQSSRMVAMDNATRNADELISKLEIKYNRLRQSMITLELVEVISGAEALDKG